MRLDTLISTPGNSYHYHQYSVSGHPGLTIRMKETAEMEVKFDPQPVSLILLYLNDHDCRKSPLQELSFLLGLGEARSLGLWLSFLIKID